jgi:hypothetical protein
MAALLPPFPDAEDVVMALLESLATTTTSTPVTLEDDGPVIKVTRVGGTDDGITDRPLVEVACFATTYEAARQLGRQVLVTTLASVNTKVVTPDYPGGVLVDVAETASSPQRVPYDNPDLQRKIGTFRFAWRRPRTV